MKLEDLRKFLDGLDTPRVFWWRDDDTGADLEPLGRLIEFRAKAVMPLVVSTIPDRLTAECRALLAQEAQIFVAQHGFDHSDHAVAGEKSIELGGNAAPDWIVDRIRQGHRCLDTNDLPNLLALMVPPWNRISEPVLAALPRLGFRSVSTFAKDQRGLPHRLAHINCHIDPILWREGKRQMTESELTQVTIKHLRAGGQRPTGLLTHHLDMDDPAYDLLADYLALMASHPMIDCCSPVRLFGRFA